MLPRERVPEWIAKPLRPFLGVWGLSVDVDPELTRPLFTLRRGLEMPGIGGWLTVGAGSAIDFDADFHSTGSLLLGFHENPKTGAAYRFSVGYTPSASRWLDWYIELSIRRSETRSSTPTSDQYAYYVNKDGVQLGVDLATKPIPPELLAAGYTREPVTDAVEIENVVRRTTAEYEGGYRFRFKTPVASIHLAAGIRFERVGALSNARFIVKAGIGPW
jgi:hypothetical protein